MASSVFQVRGQADDAPPTFYEGPLADHEVYDLVGLLELLGSYGANNDTGAGRGQFERRLNVGRFRPQQLCGWVGDRFEPERDWFNVVSRDDDR